MRLNFAMQGMHVYDTINLHVANTDIHRVSQALPAGKYLARVMCDMV
jgi:hypothetical protein